MKGDYCGSGYWLYGVFGILLIVFGYFLWAGTWTLEQALAAVIILYGAKKLYWCCNCYMGKK